MGDVFVIAVLAALDAGLLAATVVLLGRPRPARQLLAYLVGCMGFSIGIGLVIVLALHGSSVVKHPNPAVSAVIEIAAGALLLVVAVAVVLGRNAQWRPRRRGQDADADADKRPSLSERALGNDSLWIAWAAGALYSGPRGTDMLEVLISGAAAFLKPGGLLALECGLGQPEGLAAAAEASWAKAWVEKDGTGRGRYVFCQKA